MRGTTTRFEEKEDERGRERGGGQRGRRIGKMVDGDEGDEEDEDKDEDGEDGEDEDEG